MSNDRKATSISFDNNSNSKNNKNNNYRPRSPDLSAFVAKQNQQQTSHQDAFNPFTSASSFNQQLRSRQEGSVALTGLPSTSFTPVGHRGSYDANPYFTPRGSLDFDHQAQQGPPRREAFGYDSEGGLTQSPVSLAQRSASGKGVFFPQQRSHPQGQELSQQASFTQAPLLFQPLSSATSQQTHLAENTMPPGRRRRAQQDGSYDNSTQHYDPETSNAQGSFGPRASKKRRSSEGQPEWTMGRAPGDAGPSLGVDIKTKFPVARIKRIMQADEDVGKVAQATPTAVAKALELFMITLVSKAAAEAKDRSSKRVTAAHLKRAVAKDQTFDFLQEIIDKVADPSEKKGSGQVGSEDVDEGDAGPVKRKKGTRGRKKNGSDDE